MINTFANTFSRRCVRTTIGRHRAIGLELYAFRDRLSGYLTRYPKALRFTRACWATYERVDLLRAAMDGQAAADLGEHFDTGLYYPAKNITDATLADLNSRVTAALAEFADANLPGGVLPVPANPSLAGGKGFLSLAEHRVLAVDRALLLWRLRSLLGGYRVSTQPGRSVEGLVRQLERDQLIFERQAFTEPGTSAHAVTIYAVPLGPGGPLERQSRELNDHLDALLVAQLAGGIE